MARIKLVEMMQSEGAKKFFGISTSSYEKAKDHLRTGDLLFCSGNYMVSQLIQHFSESIFSHVGIIFIWNGRRLLLESVENDGVRIVPLMHYIKNYENTDKGYDGTMYIGRHEAVEQLDDSQIQRIINRGVDVLNSGYNKDEIARIACRIAIGFGKREGDKEYICSEFVAECFEHGGISFARNNKGLWYPEDIAKDDRVKPLFELVP